MLKNITLKDIDDEVENNIFISTINIVLRMISDGERDNYYALKPSNLTLEERIAFNINTEGIDNVRSIDDYCYETAIQRNNLRFIYLNDIDENILDVSRFTIYSPVDNSNKILTTFIFSKACKNDDKFTKALIGSIIYNQIDLYIYNNYGITFNDIASYVYNNPFEYDFVNASLAFTKAIVLWFRMMDGFLDLKYSDFDDTIILLLSNATSIIYDNNVLKRCYNYAIQKDDDIIELTEAVCRGIREAKFD